MKAFDDDLMDSPRENNDNDIWFYQSKLTPKHIQDLKELCEKYSIAYRNINPHDCSCYVRVGIDVENIRVYNHLYDQRFSVKVINKPYKNIRDSIEKTLMIRSFRNL